jgi:hypothetical protein
MRRLSAVAAQVSRIVDGTPYVTGLPKVARLLRTAAAVRLRSSLCSNAMTLG